MIRSGMDFTTNFSFGVNIPQTARWAECRSNEHRGIWVVFSSLFLLFHSGPMTACCVSLCFFAAKARRSFEWYGSEHQLVMIFASRSSSLGECSTIHPPPALFFFFLMEVSSRTLIPLFGLGSVHSGSASWDDCGWMFFDELRLNSFPDRHPH